MTPDIQQKQNWIDRLPDNQRRALHAVMVPRHFRKGALIFSRNEAPEGLYVVREGSALFCLDSECGRRLILKIIQPNELFGESFAQDNRPAAVSVEARTDMFVSLVPAHSLDLLERTNPEIRQALGDVSANYVRSLLELIEELVLLPLPERVLSYLQRLSLEQTGDSNAGIDVSQSELAAMLGASRQAVNIVLGQMQKCGLIQRKFRRIVLK